MKDYQRLIVGVGMFSSGILFMFDFHPIVTLSLAVSFFVLFSIMICYGGSEDLPNKKIKAKLKQ